MKTSLKWSLLLGVIAVLAVAAFVLWPMFMRPPAELDLSRTKDSAAGLYKVSVEPENGTVEQGAIHSWILTVTTPQGTVVEDAVVAVDGGMPQHGHGLPTEPRVTEYLGEGHYRVEGVRFNMGGWWELKFAISAPPGDDTVVFNIVL